MPGWYIHMEAAKKAADRLRVGDVPPGFPGGAVRAQQLGEMAHKWRNYLAAGALGPDIFFMLPDFKGTTGNVLLHAVEWTRDVWEELDKTFLSKWEKWAAPAISGVGQILNQVSGHMLEELGQVLQELAEAVKNAFLDLIIKMWDWFGILTSGVPQGFEESAFFWSDIFHYRKTYEFARTLFDNAQNEQQKAFALGWMSHCATDVTGHSFVNIKCGGPYRTHWQRHHVIENHMDALVYDSQHGGNEPYGELDTSALHFRLAFRKRNDAPYNGAEDAPAYDYFTPDFPDYTNPPFGSDPDFYRHGLWDLDTGDLPDDLCQLLIDTMRQVYYGGAVPGINIKDAPQILTDDPGFNDQGSGIPNLKTLQDTYWTLFHYVKTTSTGGYSPRKPTPPPVIGDHSPPPFPGTGGPSDSTGSGMDPGGDGKSLLDIILAIFTIPLYIGELGIWLATLPIALLNDILTWPAREILYEFAVVPMWNLYMAARKPLVMSGFFAPKPEEISHGLVTLGVSPTGPLNDLAAALASPDGTASALPSFDEPSGRSNPASAYGADPAFPRAIIADDPNLIADVIHFFGGDPFCGTTQQPSEFLSPWRYPSTNNAGQTNGWEGHLSHPGPYMQGQDARILMNHMPGNDNARTDYENATNPEKTEAVSDTHLPAGEHLGDPVDYSVYLMGRLSNDQAIPDFNLDSDRGYGYRTWEWDRNTKKAYIPPSLSGSKYRFNEPCTVPEGFCAASGPHYDPFTNLAIHYGETPDGACDPKPTKVTPDDVKQAGGIQPNGGREQGHGG